MSVIERVNAFVQSAWIESKKVTWPTRTELLESTRVVIVATLAIMVFLFVVDRGLSLILGLFVR
jgi:preprotein translocase subunit SecE